jgi:hypothetical protein
MCFVDAASGDVPPPTVGAIDALPSGLVYQGADSFSVERRRGWSESNSTPPRAADDTWDERRGAAIEMVKPNPQTGSALHVRGGDMASFRYGELNVETCPRYALKLSDGRRDLFDGVQWADWTRDGRLLVATVGGELQIREGDSVVWRYDTTNDLSRRAAPPSARVW